MCNCKLTETILAIVIIVFAYWQTMYSQWIVVIAAVILLVHSLGCKDMCCGVKTSKPAAKSSAKKKR